MVEYLPFSPRLDPETVCARAELRSGTPLRRRAEALFPRLEEILRRQLFPVHAANLRIMPAQFGADSGLVGAGLMAADYAAGTLE